MAVRRLRGKVSYNVIGKLLEAIHDEFGIEAKVTMTITDNGSNFLKAFRLFGAKEFCEVPLRATLPVGRPVPSQDAGFYYLHFKKLLFLFKMIF